MTGTSVMKDTAWKVSKYGVFSGLYFPVFRPNTGKYGPEKTLYMNTFRAIRVTLFMLGILGTGVLENRLTFLMEIKHSAFLFKFKRIT